MGMFKRKQKKEKDDADKEQAPPPPAIDIFGGDNSVVCTVRSPWQWVLERAGKEFTQLEVVDKPADLPTGKLAAIDNGESSQSGAPSTPSSRRRRKKGPAPCTLRIEVRDGNGEILEAVHGTSEAFDGLEDKDELVRTMQRCRCEQLELSPPTRLINWDVTKEECLNVVGASLPTLVGNPGGEKMAVLKEPMGSSGTGIFFVRNAQEIHEIVEEQRKRASEEPGFLDNLIAAKGRIPSWGKLLFSQAIMLSMHGL
jgi:hypothetical protein